LRDLAKSFILAGVFGISTALGFHLYMDTHTPRKIHYERSVLPISLKFLFHLIHWLLSYKWPRVLLWYQPINSIIHMCVVVIVSMDSNIRANVDGYIMIVCIWVLLCLLSFSQIYFILSNLAILGFCIWQTDNWILGIRYTRFNIFLA